MFLTGQGTARRLARALEAMSFHRNAGRRRESMLSRMKKVKLMVMAASVACVCGLIALPIAWATLPQGFTSTNIVGPVVLDEIHTKAEGDDWKVELKAKGFSDVYMTNIKIVPGGHGGWHSHPGPSIITVKSGTATFYDECDDFLRHSYPAGTGFVEDAGCVHLLANEGDVDLEVVIFQIVPVGAPRRIDEPDPGN
jgi:quercetin dioxygenase-like cupin family protein